MPLLLLRVNDPLRPPVALGVKVTLIVQLPPAARLLPQLLVWLKSPVTLMALKVNATFPVFVKVTVWAGLAVCTS